MCIVCYIGSKMFMAQIPATQTCETSLRFCNMFLNKTLLVIHDIFIYYLRAYACIACLLVRNIYIFNILNTHIILFINCQCILVFLLQKIILNLF